MSSISLVDDLIHGVDLLLSNKIGADSADIRLAIEKVEKAVQRDKALGINPELSLKVAKVVKKCLDNSKRIEDKAWANCKYAHCVAHLMVRSAGEKTFELTEEAFEKMNTQYEIQLRRVMGLNDKVREKLRAFGSEGWPVFDIDQSYLEARNIRVKKEAAPKVRQLLNSGAITVLGNTLTEMMTYISESERPKVLENLFSGALRPQGKELT